MKATTPAKVLVKITVNPRLADDLRQAGFTAYRRTMSDMVDINTRHEQSAQDRGVQPYRFATGETKTRETESGTQTMTTGRRVADSGTPVFGRDGQHNVALTMVHDDIAAQLPELKLVGVNMQTKADGKSVVWQVYEPATSEKPEIKPSGGVKYHLDVLNKRIYGHVHVWRNPDESITVNAGSPMNDDVKDAKNLRIYEQGRSIRCVAR